MKFGPSRPLAVALASIYALTACGEKPTPDVTPTTSAAAVTSATAAVTATATASAEASGAATAEPAPTATASASASAPTSATASASAVASAKPTSKPKPAATTPKESASAASTAAPSASAAASSAPSASAAAAEIPAPAEGSADAIAQKIDAIFAPSKKNFFAKFKQRLEQKVSGTKKESSGTLNIERPNKISFRYDPPNKNRIVSDGTTLKAYVAEDEQMFESKVGNSSYAGGLAFFMGGLLKTMSFTFNEKVDYKDGYVLIGKPRTPSATYELAMFYVNKALLEKGDPNCIERVVIVDAQGNKNRFDFTEAAFPASVAATEWEFTPPAGTNITKN